METINLKKHLQNQNVPFYIGVLDFEATCEEKKPNNHEIIEFPTILFEWIPDSDSVHWRELGRFESFVRPKNKPIISDFCHSLTSITQDDIENAPPLDQVWLEHYQWLLMMIGGEKNLEKTFFLTCGAWDLQTMMTTEARNWRIFHYPEVYHRFCNIKKSFENWFGEGRGGLAGLMRHYNLQFEGHHHRGIDDCWNTSRIVEKMLKKGFQFKPEDIKSSGFIIPKQFRKDLSKSYNLFQLNY